MNLKNTTNMSRTKNFLFDVMQHQNNPSYLQDLIDSELTYLEAIEHKTFFLDEDGSKSNVTIDFRKVAGIGDTEEDGSCFVIIGGNPFVILTPKQIADQLWKAVK